MTQTVTPPSTPDGDCPVCDEPYYEKKTKSHCIGRSPVAGYDNYCSRAAGHAYVTEYFIHDLPDD